MSTYKIIDELTLERSEKETLLALASYFDKYMPKTLYLDPYELAYGEKTAYHESDPRNQNKFKGVSNTTPEQWDQFLDIPEIYRYRHARIAKLTEYSAIKSMKALEEQGLSGGQSSVAALKEIASLSKQLSGNNNKQKIILTYVKPKREKVETSNDI